MMPQKHGLLVQIQDWKGTSFSEDVISPDSPPGSLGGLTVDAPLGKRFQVCITLDKDFEWFDADTLLVSVACSGGTPSSEDANNKAPVWLLRRVERPSRFILKQILRDVTGQIPSTPVPLGGGNGFSATSFRTANASARARMLH